MARVRHNIDVHLDTLAADLVKALEEDGGKVTTDRLSDLARSASNLSAQEGKLDMLAKLVAAMRLQDEASSIKGILESLARGSSTGRPHAWLCCWSMARHFGLLLILDMAGARPNDVPVDSYVALKKVVADRFRLVLSATPGARLPDVPPFMRAMSGNSGVVVLVVVAIPSWPCSTPKARSATPIVQRRLCGWSMLRCSSVMRRRGSRI